MCSAAGMMGQHWHCEANPLCVCVSVYVCIDNLALYGFWLFCLAENHSCFQMPTENLCVSQEAMFWSRACKCVESQMYCISIILGTELKLQLGHTR